MFDEYLSPVSIVVNVLSRTVRLGSREGRGAHPPPPVLRGNVFGLYSYLIIKLRTHYYHCVQLKPEFGTVQDMQGSSNTMYLRKHVYPADACYILQILAQETMSNLQKRSAAGGSVKV